MINSVMNAEFFNEQGLSVIGSGFMKEISKGSGEIFLFSVVWSFDVAVGF
jgi:hypothetical protein